MTRDDIIRIYMQVSDELCGGTEWCLAGVGEPLQRFAALVAAEERNKPHVILERGDVAWTRYKNRIERMQSDGWRQCAVGQSTTQHCGMLEDAVMAEREACALIAENQWEIPGTQRRTAERCASAIRARSK